MRYFYLAIVIAIIAAQISCNDEKSLREQPMSIEENIKGKNGIIIVSHHTLDAGYLKYTFENHKAYARNGYDYWFRNGLIDDKFVDPDGKNHIFKKGLYWQKIATVRQALDVKGQKGERKYQWVMWIDADALFTDFNKRIESILLELTNNEFLVISQDYLGVCINTGIWIIKNDDRGRHFLDVVEKAFPYYKANQYPEQHAVQDLIFGYITEEQIDQHKVAKYEPRTCPVDDIIPGVKVLPQRALNAYYTPYAVSHPNASWHPGDYIAHAAGGADKTTLIKRLMECMKAKGTDLQGCEVNGSWQPTSSSGEMSR